MDRIDIKQVFGDMVNTVLKVYLTADALNYRTRALPITLLYRTVSVVRFTDYKNCLRIVPSDKSLG